MVPLYTLFACLLNKIFMTRGALRNQDESSLIQDVPDKVQSVSEFPFQGVGQGVPHRAKRAWGLRALGLGWAFNFCRAKSTPTPTQSSQCTSINRV